MRMFLNDPALTANQGHDAGWLAEALLVRDVLTELLIAGAHGGASLFGVLGMQPPPPVTGVNGIAVMQTTPDQPPELVVFTDQHASPLAHIMVPLQGRGMPIRTVAGVSFHAAARPVQGGESLGHGVARSASGTMGCVVRSRLTQARYALTCNHVIADLNRAAKGATEVWAPASGNGGTAADRLGVVEDFGAIDFRAGVYNVMDAATARPDDPANIDPAIASLGRLSGVGTVPSFGDPVRKSGAVSGVTDGTFLYRINAQIDYGGGHKALFKDMLGIVGTTVDFGKRGDSGAVVVDAGMAAVGLVISVASGIDLTLATDIAPVLSYFSMDIV